MIRLPNRFPKISLSIVPISLLFFFVNPSLALGQLNTSPQIEKQFIAQLSNLVPIKTIDNARQIKSKKIEVKNRIDLLYSLGVINEDQLYNLTGALDALVYNPNSIQGTFVLEPLSDLIDIVNDLSRG